MCENFEPGASGLPYYCTPPVCVPDVIGALAVWRQNIKKKKNERSLGSLACVAPYQTKNQVAAALLWVL